MAATSQLSARLPSMFPDSPMTAPASDHRSIAEINHVQQTTGVVYVRDGEGARNFNAASSSDSENRASTEADMSDTEEFSQDQLEPTSRAPNNLMSKTVNDKKIKAKAKRATSSDRKKGKSLDSYDVEPSIPLPNSMSRPVRVKRSPSEEQTSAPWDHSSLANFQPTKKRLKASDSSDQADPPSLSTTTNTTSQDMVVDPAAETDGAALFIGFVDAAFQSPPPASSRSKTNRSPTSSSSSTSAKIESSTTSPPKLNTPTASQVGSLNAAPSPSVTFSLSPEAPKQRKARKHTAPLDLKATQQSQMTPAGTTTMSGLIPPNNAPPHISIPVPPLSHLTLPAALSIGSNWQSKAPLVADFASSSKLNNCANHIKIAYQIMSIKKSKQLNGHSDGNISGASLPPRPATNRAFSDKPLSLTPSSTVFSNSVDPSVYAPMDLNASHLQHMLPGGLMQPQMPYPAVSNQLLAQSLAQAQAANTHLYYPMLRAANAHLVPNVTGPQAQLYQQQLWNQQQHYQYLLQLQLHQQQQLYLQQQQQQQQFQQKLHQHIQNQGQDTKDTKDSSKSEKLADPKSPPTSADQSLPQNPGSENNETIEFVPKTPDGSSSASTLAAFVSLATQNSTPSTVPASISSISQPPITTPHGSNFLTAQVAVPVSPSDQSVRTSGSSETDATAPTP